MDPESVETRVVDVAMVGQDVQLDELENLVGDDRFEHLDRFALVVVAELAEVDRVRILVRGLQTEDDEVFRRRVDRSGRRHRLRDVLDGESGRTHRRREFDD